MRTDVDDDDEDSDEDEDAAAAALDDDVRNDCMFFLISVLCAALWELPNTLPWHMLNCIDAVMVEAMRCYHKTIMKNHRQSR